VLEPHSGLRALLAQGIAPPTGRVAPRRLFGDRALGVARRAIDRCRRGRQHGIAVRDPLGARPPGRHRARHREPDDRRGRARLGVAHGARRRDPLQLADQRERDPRIDRATRRAT